MPEPHSWRNCWPQLGPERESPVNRQIRKIIKGLPESDRIKLHQANCQGKYTSTHLAVVKKVRMLLANAGIGDAPADGSGMIVLCINADMAQAIPSGALGPDIQSPVSIDHTLTTCSRCTEQCWIGPRQREAVRSGNGVTVCYKCALADPELRSAIDHKGAYIALDPNADAKPRRP